jgi:hypothetical protein
VPLGLTELQLTVMTTNPRIIEISSANPDGRSMHRWRQTNNISQSVHLLARFDVLYSRAFNVAE